MKVISTLVVSFLMATAVCLGNTTTSGTVSASPDVISDKDHPALVPAPKTGTAAAKFMRLHESFLERGKEGPIGVLFLGDSITERWTSAPLIWQKYFGKYSPANFGIGGDRTQHILWRITTGKELDGLKPKVLVLMIGTNNANTDEPEYIAEGIKRIVNITREKLPETKILLLSIFPRAIRGKEKSPLPPERVEKTNAIIAKLHDGKNVHYLDVTDDFLVDGKVTKEIMPDGVHLSDKGYEIWGKAITPKLEELLK